MYAFPDFLPIFASGNYGQKGFQTVVAPSSAKKSVAELTPRTRKKTRIRLTDISTAALVRVPQYTVNRRGAKQSNEEG